MIDIKLPQGRIGVAVSGGIDSMVLLHCLIEKRADLLVINIEHGIRGAESHRDSDFVASFCKKNKIKFRPFSVNTIKESQKRKESLELCARNLRYNIFKKLLQKKEIDYIALGHHADDNIETILMRIMRGTGIRGLKGICDHNKFIHPLISYSRQQIEEYAKTNKIEYVIDSTNKEDGHTRNFIRNNILPLLKVRFDNVYEGFQRLLSNAKEADEFIISHTLKIFSQKNGFYVLLKDFVSAHPIVQKYTVHKLLNKLGIFQDIEARHYDYIQKLISMQNNAFIDLPYGIVAIKEYDRIVFMHLQDIAIKEYCKGFNLQNTYTYKNTKYSFAATDKIIAGKSFDADKIPQSTVIRTRQRGDIFKRYSGGTKSLSEYLTDIKIPMRIRNELLVIAEGSEVLMVCGIEISDKIKVDKHTTKIFYIKKEIL